MGPWFTSLGVGYFYVFVITLVVGAMGALMISERLKRGGKRLRGDSSQHVAKGQRSAKPKPRHRRKR